MTRLELAYKKQMEICETSKPCFEAGYKSAMQDFIYYLKVIKEYYSEDIFPNHGTSIDCHSARMARHLINKFIKNLSDEEVDDVPICGTDEVNKEFESKKDSCT